MRCKQVFTLLIAFWTSYLSDGFLIIQSSSSLAKSQLFLRNEKHLHSSSSIIDEPILDSKDGGIQTFEEWFQAKTSNDKDNKSMKLLKHDFFSNGRGLAWIGNKADLTNYDGPIITLPKEFVLQSTFVDKEELEDISTSWDVTLAMKLLRECKLGEGSSIYG